jgi:hypothetical protein
MALLRACLQEVRALHGQDAPPSLLECASTRRLRSRTTPLLPVGSATQPLPPHRVNGRLWPFEIQAAHRAAH